MSWGMSGDGRGGNDGDRCTQAETRGPADGGRLAHTPAGMPRRSLPGSAPLRASARYYHYYIARAEGAM